MRLRAHNLLCLQGFVGKGYSKAFVANMTAVAARLRDDPQTPVTVAVGPDALCSACPNLEEDGCALHGPGSEPGIRSQDLRVLALLGLKEGETLPWREILERIRSAAPGTSLRDLCGSCPWLPLGHCEAALSRLAAGAG